MTDGQMGTVKWRIEVRQVRNVRLNVALVRHWIKELARFDATQGLEDRETHM